jgi:hypothetical protein
MAMAYTQVLNQGEIAARRADFDGAVLPGGSRCPGCAYLGVGVCLCGWMVVMVPLIQLVSPLVVWCLCVLVALARPRQAPCHGVRLTP